MQGGLAQEGCYVAIAVYHAWPWSIRSGARRRQHGGGGRPLRWLGVRSRLLWPPAAGTAQQQLTHAAAEPVLGSGFEGGGAAAEETADEQPGGLEAEAAEAVVAQLARQLASDEADPLVRASKERDLTPQRKERLAERAQKRATRRAGRGRE